MCFEWPGPPASVLAYRDDPLLAALRGALAARRALLAARNDPDGLAEGEEARLKEAQDLALDRLFVLVGAELGAELPDDLEVG